MKFLANENFPRSAVEALRAYGHDVLWARSDLTGATDDVILARAVADQRVLITFDKDFGELAFRGRLPSSCGIVLFRIDTGQPGIVAPKIVQTLASRDDWAGQFAVVEENRIRMRSLPDIPEDDRT